MENKQKIIAEKHIQALANLYQVPVDFILMFDPENVMNSYSDYIANDRSSSQTVLSEIKLIEQKLDQLISMIEVRNGQHAE
jgi:uncharacterized lipoprotein YbaY